MNKKILSLARQCILDEAAAISGLAEQLDDNFERAVELILNCRGKVIVTGVGKSGHIGQKIAATFSSTGTPAFFVNPLDAFHGDMGSITDRDVVLAISNSGNTDELLRLVPLLLYRHVPIVGMASDRQSLLAKHSAAFILVKVNKEACPLNLAPTSSTTAQLAMGDALAVVLMATRKFKKTDFASLHPGGHLGKTLLTTAADVMRTADLPLLPEEMNLGEAIIHVSKGKLGLGISVDDSNHIIGLITDGDIRRAMERWQEKFFRRTVGDILTRTPKVVPPSMKLSEILHMMHKYKIHMVLVADEENHLLGVVDHYSCMI